MKRRRGAHGALAVILSLAMVLGLAPALGAAAGAEEAYVYAQRGNFGADIIFSQEVTAVSVDLEELARASFSGNTVTVTGLEGAVGVTAVAVTAGGLDYRVAVPVGYTTFIFDADSLTVWEGSCSNYKVTGYDSAETEFAPAAENGDGSTTYSSDGDYSLCVELKASGGVFAFAGSGRDMSVAVKKNAAADVTLLLAGMELTSSMTAPVTVKKKDDEGAVAAGAKVYITALEGHVNTLADSAYNNEDDNPENVLAESAVIKGKSFANIVLNGHGTLKLDCASKNAVKVADGGSLTVRELTLTVESAGHGVSSDNELTVRSGTVNVTAAKDGIRSDPNADDTESLGNIIFYDADVTVVSGNDGIQAAGDLTVYGGRFRVTTGGGYRYNNELGDGSAKGLKAAASSSSDGTDTSGAENRLSILGGVFFLDCADDAVHSDCDAEISGGEFTIYTGDDGVHADTTLLLGAEGAPDCAVHMDIAACYEGLESGTVYLRSGSFSVVSSDDGVNAAGGAGGSSQGFNPRPGGPGGGGGPGWGGGRTDPFGGESSGDYSINISGGLLKVTASGDGVDSNGDLVISGGTLVVWGGRGAENPLDYDGTFTVTGGTVFAAGRSEMRVREPAAGSQSYRTSNVNLTAGNTVTVTVNGGTAVSQTVPSNGAGYVFYSQSQPFTSMSVSQSAAAADGAPAAWLGHTGEGVCEACGLSLDGSYGAEDPEASENDDRVDAVGEDEGFAVTFDVDGGTAGIDVYYTQDYTAPDETGAAAAYSRDGDTGKKDSSGGGQVNFLVRLAEGYALESVSASEGTYKNIKGPADTGVENLYRITKISGDTVVTVRTAAAEDPGQPEEDENSFTADGDTGTAHVFWDGPAQGDYVLILAFYDGDGRLLQADRAEITWSGQALTVTGLNCPGAFDRTAAYLLDRDMKPAAEVLGLKTVRE